MNPKPGDVLLSHDGRHAYAIRAVKVLHHGTASPKPRLDLTVVKEAPGILPKPGREVHAWARTIIAPPSDRVEKRDTPAPAPKPKPKAKRERRLTVDDHAAAARAARLAAQVAPPLKADKSRWDDPNDSVNTKTPVQITGYRRGDMIGRLLRRGLDVTRDHAIAANLFRVDWDIAHIGLSGGAGFTEKVGGGGGGPSTGPTLAASTRVAKQREVARVLALVGPAAAPLLIWTVIENRDVQGWCNDQAPALGRKPDAKKEIGRLVAILDRLTEFYGVDSRRDAARKARKEMSQR